MNYKIVILTIERNKERYLSIYNYLINEGFEKKDIYIFIGIDYKKIKTTSLNKIISYYGIFTPNSVICCALTHILSWKKVLDFNDTDYFIFLEDDAFIIKKKFLEYQKDIENMIKNNFFLNMSSGLSIYEKPYIIKNNFIKSNVVLSLECYVLNKNLCKKLFNYYLKNKIFHHIDFDLGFVLKKINIELYHYKFKITKNENRLKSTMVDNHEKMFFLKNFKNKETYKELLTPLFQIKNYVFNSYNLIVILIIVIFSLFIYFISIFKIKLYLHEYIIMILINCFILFLVYDF